jgi:predicted double-glycine peptidase
MNPFTLLKLLGLSLFLCACAIQKPLLSNAGYPLHNSNAQITSWKALNEQHIIMQKYDYSCGAASLATLMKYYFNEEINEQKLLDYIKTVFNKQEYKRIEKDGLSFLELEKISRSRGYQSANVRLKLSALKQLSGPVIVFLKTKDYRHFAVLRGVREDRVFLADPSRGNIRLSIKEFTKEWKGETFVLGKAGFGTPLQHNLAILHQAGFRNELDALRPVLLDRPQTDKARLE